MNNPLVIGCLWVVAATITAMLPMRMQRYPGLPLLIDSAVVRICEF